MSTLHFLVLEDKLFRSHYCKTCQICYLSRKVSVVASLSRHLSRLWRFIPDVVPGGGDVGQIRQVPLI